VASEISRAAEEVHERLDARKREDERFIDLLARLTGQERDADAGFGTWEDRPCRASASGPRFVERRD